MATLGDDALIRSRYQGGLQGASFDFNTTPVGREVSIGRVNLEGVLTPWVLFASSAQNFAAGAAQSLPNRVRALLSVHGGSLDLVFDLPDRGGYWLLPPSESIVVSAVVNYVFALLPGAAAPQQRLAFGPAQHGIPVNSSPMVYTEALQAVGPAGGVTFARPVGATHYRLYATDDLAGYSLTVTQASGAATAVSADTSAGLVASGPSGEWAKTEWLPLHPTADRVIAINPTVASHTYGLQWRLGDS